MVADRKHSSGWRKDHLQQILRCKSIKIVKYSALTVSKNLIFKTIFLDSSALLSLEQENLLIESQFLKMFTFSYPVEFTILFGGKRGFISHLFSLLILQMRLFVAHFYLVWLILFVLRVGFIGIGSCIMISLCCRYTSELTGLRCSAMSKRISAVHYSAGWQCAKASI